MFSNAVAGESALDRMACGLGGKLVLPMIKEHIMQMLQNRKLPVLQMVPWWMCPLKLKMVSDSVCTAELICC